jgi:hypothetical protein
MSGYPATPCPWGRSKLTLDIKELKPSEKEWLGRGVAGYVFIIQAISGAVLIFVMIILKCAEKKNAHGLVFELD